MTDDVYQERYSVCVLSVSEESERHYFKYYRIADYDPKSPAEIAPSIVQANVSTPDEKRTYPDYLYDPKIAEKYGVRDSDFYFFRWGWAYDSRGRALADARGAEGSFGRGYELKEVIIPDVVHDEESLRHALRKGIPFTGKTTKTFYLVYKSDGRSLLAAKCDRNDFSFNDGLLSLPPKVTNVRGHSLSVPSVLLDSQEVIESAHPEVHTRKVYGSLCEPETSGKVLLRMLDDYADDYVRWFIRQEKIDEITRAERQQAIRSLIESALSRPDALERYLEAEVPAEDIESFRNAITASAFGQDDEARKLIRSALLRDNGFRDECLQQVIEESAEALKCKENELEDAQAQLEEVKQKTSAAQDRLAEVIAERDLVEEEIARGRSELERISKDEESALNELESNIALRLGLKVATSSPSTAAEGSELLVTEGADVEKTFEAEFLWEALSKNMRRFGVSCLVGNQDEALNQSAVGIEAALGVTHVLAIPSPIARFIADALAIALSGKTARRVQVPSGHRGLKGLIGELPQAGEVTLFNNIIDPVNEGALFAIIGSDFDGIVVLPFVSHASALLVAREAWEGMFLPCVESLCLTPSCKCPNGRMWRKRDACCVKSLDSDYILDTTRELIADFEGVGLPNSGYLLPGAVLSAFSDMSESDNVAFDPLSIISQHLGIAAGLEGDSYRLLREKSEGDVGLLELARRLGKDAR